MRENGHKGMRKGMTESVVQNAGKILARVLIPGFGLQILLGVLWACLQFPYVQEFGESLLLQKAAETFTCDEYMGIAYLLVIRAAKALSFLIPLPEHCFIYAAQLLAATAAAIFFLNSLESVRARGKLFRVWAVLALLTLPMAMQCHLAVLPHSLATSLMLMQLGVSLRGRKAKGKEALLLTACGLLWLGETLLLPSFEFLGGAVFVWTGLRDVLRRLPVRGEGAAARQAGADLQGAVRLLLLCGAMAGLVIQIGAFSRQEGAHGRMQNSLQAAAFRRFVWDDFGELYADWPAELKEALTQEEIAECNKYPERKSRILGEKVDGVYGRERAREIYWTVAKAGMRIRWKRNLKEILMDGAGYGAAPLANLILMEGKGQKSYAAMNYEVMRMKAPKVTSLYVRFGGWLFGGAALISLLLLVMAFLKADGAERTELARAGAPLLMLCVVFVLFFTFQGGGVMDHKNVLPVTTLWAAWAMAEAAFWVGKKDDGN